MKRAIRYFRYQPKEIQTDNGSEFTNFRKTDRVHIFDHLCAELGITHKLIRPRTPWHNGKVERSYRNDQDRFYNHLRFYDFEDLKTQMRRYLNRSNGIPMMTLGWKNPIEKHTELMGGHLMRHAARQLSFGAPPLSSAAVQREGVAFAPRRYPFLFPILGLTSLTNVQI